MDATTSFEIEGLSALQDRLRAQGETRRTWLIATNSAVCSGLNEALAAANARYAGLAVFARSGTGVRVTVYGGGASTLTVASALGAPDPAVGVHTYAYGDSVTATVAASVYSGANDATRRDVTGWTGTGSVPASGTSNTVTFVQTEDSFLTWNWSDATWQKILVGGTLTWKDFETEQYTDGTESWVPGGAFAESSAWTDPETLASGRLRILAGGTYTVDRDATLAGIDFSAKAEPVVFEATGRTLNLTGTVNFHTKSVVTLKGGTYAMNLNSFMPQNNWANNRRQDMNLVLDGAVVTNAGRFTMGYYGATGNNTLVLTNGAVYCQKAGDANGDTCWLCFAGAGGNLVHVSTGSRFSVPCGLVFHHDGKGAKSAGSTLVIDGEGSEVTTGAAGAMAQDLGSQCLVRNGGRLIIGGWWEVNTNALVSIEDSVQSVRTNSLSSPYFYGTGARFRFKNANARIGALYGTAGAAASNNWIEVIDADLYVDSTAHRNSDESGRNVCYRFAGTHPHVQHGPIGGGLGGSDFKNGTRFVYELPLAGYDRDADGNATIPLDVQNWGTMDASVRFEVENVEAVKAGLMAQRRTRGVWKLATFRNHENVGLAVAASNAAAPEDVRFSYANNTLRVTVVIPGRGIIISVR